MIFRQVRVLHGPPLTRSPPAVDGPGTALGLVGALDLGTYHLFHAIRADLLRRLGRGVEAETAYETAIKLTGNAAERDFLRRRRQSVAG